MVRDAPIMNEGGIEDRSCRGENRCRMFGAPKVLRVSRPWRRREQRAPQRRGSRRGPYAMIRAVYAVLLAVVLCGAQVARADAVMSAPEAFAAAREGRALLIDIRTPQEWRETGVAPGAARVDFYRGPQVLLDSVLRLVEGDRTKPIALICRTGNRTTQAQKFLQQQGFTRVYNVREGMAGSAAGPGWLARGLPVERCADC
jgi:rhodanese-related sulfurtransferase